jgi:SAM-dependent methyltransferase
MKELAQRAKIVSMSDMVLPHGDHNITLLSIVHRWFRDIALPQASGVMLDFGCGGQEYRSLFETRIHIYIGADVAAAIGVNLDLVITPGTPLELECQSIDTVLTIQTLEHDYDFRNYPAEYHRLLRPGGNLMLTVPCKWRMQEAPFDYWRFTKYGILAALREQGSEVEHISQCGGAWALLGQLLNSLLAAKQRGSKMLLRVTNRIALWMVKRCPDAKETIGWICLAKMPMQSG